MGKMKKEDLFIGDLVQVRYNLVDYYSEPWNYYWSGYVKGLLDDEIFLSGSSTRASHCWNCPYEQVVKIISLSPLRDLKNAT